MNLKNRLQQYIDCLPVGSIADDVNASLSEKHRLVVTAPPGSGKSTLLPLTVADRFDKGKIIVLEPRRAAARQIALRMAQMLGEEPGETVGYRMRFESRTSASTRIEVVTEGVMERMLIDDPTLDGIEVVIFDEFHERSLAADLDLALTLEAQNVVRPDLRILLMSATMDAEALCSSLGAPMIEAHGRLFDVGVVNTDDADISDCVPAVVSAIRRACREQPGNILAFLPGQGEIARCTAALTDSLTDAVVMPLHGMLPPAEQYRAIEYNPEGLRKIVLSTPISETSLTIEGIRTVVDSGLCRAVRYDISTGLGRLATERISMDMARQRTGRAGRLADGVCYRLWSKATEHRMKENRTPEILDADLSAMVLEVAAWGGEPSALPWLTPPPAGHISEAIRLLRMLNSVDENGKITDHGRRMVSLPCHPRIANMLLCASDDRMRALAADIAAIVEEKDPVNDENDADINARIVALRHKRKSGGDGRWSRIINIAAQYRKLVHCREDNGGFDAFSTGKLLARAYPERIAMRHGDGIYRLPSGENIRISESDNLSGQECLAVASMDRRIFLASPVGRDALECMAKPYRNVSWNSREGRVVMREESRIGVLVVSSRPIVRPDSTQIADVICRAAAKEGRSMFDFNDDVATMQRRIELVSEWHPEFNLPDLSADILLANAEEWLLLYLGTATTLQELRRIDLCAVMAGLVGYERMKDIDRIAPTHLRLPGGRNVRIDYRAGTSVPVVSARLQDCFGMFDTPALDDGRRPVLMELLSPGFKPVQLTQDLRGFWKNTYFEVRKELKRRYPKHRWPDDPFNFE